MTGMTYVLKVKRGLIYQQDGDGWTVVASCVTGTPQDNELAALLAQAPKLKEQRDDLLAACEAFVDVTAPLSRRTAGRDDVWEDTIRMAREAIAKARDEQEAE